MLLDEELTVGLLQSAWERVAYNEGGPGVDGVTIESFTKQAQAALPELRLHALGGVYRAMPLRKVVVQKRPGSEDTRTLHIPSVRDRVLQTGVARMLSRSFEEEFLEASYAYRPDRGVDRAVARILQLRDRGYTTVLDADIRSFFDSIPHRILLEQLSGHAAGDERLIELLKQWVHAAEWDGHEAHPLRRGISQGSPISPLLANLFLTPLDALLATGDHKLIRYSDDFLILCRGEAEAASARELARQGLESLGLELKTEKTRITNFEDGFSFLGVRFREGEAMIPWKAKNRAAGRVIFVAHLMTSKQLRPYRDWKDDEAPASESPAAQRPQGWVHPQPVAGSELESDMPYLYLTQTGAVLRKSGDRFLVDHDGSIILDVPYHRLEHILIFGSIQVTSQAMTEALEHNIALSLFSRQGRYRGSLTPPAGQNVLLRLQQYGLHQNSAEALGAARECIRFKIENGLTVLERYEERHRLTEESLSAVERLEAEMTGTQSRLDDAEMDSTASLLGHEGAAAKAYFEALEKFNQSDFAWPGRRKHPATDPLNGLLSLTYTMVMNELSALVSAHGLDPAIGFLHEIDGERPGLALDLMEPFRAPVADRLVWTLVNRRQFAEHDFERRDASTGVFLRPEAQRRFFEAYEKWMLTPVGMKELTPAGEEKKPRTFRSLLRSEVSGFAQFLKAGGSWSPFCYARVLGSEGKAEMMAAPKALEAEAGLSPLAPALEEGKG